MEEIRILIADDQAMIRKGIESMLQAQDKFEATITEVSNGAEVLDALRKQEFDIILMDVQMPKLDGVSTLKKLRGKKVSIPILMMSVYCDDRTIQQVIELGSNGFIMKDIGIEELSNSILTVIGGERYFSNKITQMLLGSKPNKKKGIGIENYLTRRESQVLDLIIKELNNVEIAKELGISPRTVESHKKNLTFKLDVKTSVGLVKVAFKSGLID
jgi:DNA-binding NarL/FixJ family response regulator